MLEDYEVIKHHISGEISAILDYINFVENSEPIKQLQWTTLLYYPTAWDGIQTSQ
jgi:hypothetical protein